MKRCMALTLAIGMHAYALNECTIITPVEKDIQTTWLQKIKSHACKNIYKNAKIAAVAIPLTISVSSKTLTWWSRLLAQKSNFTASYSIAFLGAGLRTFNVKLIAPIAAIYLACVALEEAFNFVLLKYFYRKTAIEEARRIYGEKRLDEIEAYIESFDANVRRQFIRFAVSAAAAIGILKLP